MKILAFFLAFIFFSTVTTQAKDVEKITILEGLIEEVKDGLYLEGVHIFNDADLEKRGQTRAHFAGKKVKVKGVVREVTREDPNKGKDSLREPMIQSRGGTWKVMDRVDEITLIP